MNGLNPLQSNYSEFVEVDPTGRYGRYNEILGKGASKTVYRAFDEFEGIEVAWNQVKLYDFLQSPEDLERLYCEIHLLKTLKHKNIMKFCTSWVDTAKRNINFVTEMFTSGTLRQYRQKHKRVNIRAVKHWCRQILKGLLYLHSHDPPVIHRDLKCDNIFVNGHKGEVKIGDLGLAAILRKSDAAHCVGTPEFMAPEVYKEEYNELVDIYAFGMCVLEMVTFEYPYSECMHPAQIYKKVISGKMPAALYKVEDPKVRQFVEKCLVTVSLRLPASELLKDPFLQIDDCRADLRQIDYSQNYDGISPLLRQHLFQHSSDNNSSVNGDSNYHHNNSGFEPESGWQYHPVDIETNGIELFTYNEDDPPGVNLTIKGRLKDDDSIFLRLRIADKEGRIRNIYFPFDIEIDTALSVATEMVAELDITDQDVTKIAYMIDGEIASLVPEWETGPCIEESPHYESGTYCDNCASKRSSLGSLMDYLSFNDPDVKNMQVVKCHGCAAMHGRFEEITYQVEDSEQCLTEGAPQVSSQSDTDTFAQHESSLELRETHLEEEHEQFDQSTSSKDVNAIDERVLFSENPFQSSPHTSLVEDDYENEIRHELRWAKAKYQTELRELRNRRLKRESDAPSSSPDSSNREYSIKSIVACSPRAIPVQGDRSKLILKSFASGKHFSSYLAPSLESCPESETQMVQHSEATPKSISPEKIITANSFYTRELLPRSHRRTTSLPVDAIDV